MTPRKLLYQEFILTSDNLASLNLEELVIRKFAQFQIPTAIGGKNEGVWSSKISWKRWSKSRGKDEADALWLNESRTTRIILSNVRAYFKDIKKEKKVHLYCISLTFVRTFLHHLFNYRFSNTRFSNRD